MVPFMADTSAIPQEAMETLGRASTGMVCDALGMAGIEGGLAGVRPVRGFEDAKIVGPAATVLYAHPRLGDPGLTMYRAARASAPGSVLVIDGKGLDCRFTGDNQGECAKRHGLLATVVYGGARDIAGYRALGMPLFCTGSAPRDKPKELRLVAHNVPLDLGGVLVKPGDVIVADEDGVVAIPREALETVLLNLKTIAEVEEGMEKAIRADAPVEAIEGVIAKKKGKK